MKTKLMLACVAISAFPTISAAGPVMYSYTGNRYDVTLSDTLPGSFQPPRITGWIAFTEQIAPNTHVSFDQTGFPTFASFSFWDGRNTQARSIVTSEGGSFSITLDTDASGQIEAWSVQTSWVRFGRQRGMLTTNSCGIVCDEAFEVADFGTDRAGASTPGTWTVTPVPEPETYALMLAGLALVGFAAKRRMRLPN